MLQGYRERYSESQEVSEKHLEVYRVGGGLYLEISGEFQEGVSGVISRSAHESRSRHGLQGVQEDLRGVSGGSRVPQGVPGCLRAV